MEKLLNVQKIKIENYLFQHVEEWALLELFYLQKLDY